MSDVYCEYRCKVTFECHGGYLHDRDYDYIDYEDITYPCPNCNKKQFFLYELEDGIADDELNELIEWYCDKFNTSKKELTDFINNLKTEI